MLLFDRHALGLFLTDPSSIAIGRHINHLAVWSFAFFGVTFVLSGVVRATGAVFPPLLILFFAMWLVRIPFANLMIGRLGADAIWWSFPISSLVSVSLSIAYYRFGNWKAAHMLSNP